jgi:hypothetical protein
MRVLDGSAIWRQAHELDTTIRLPLHAGRKLRECVCVCVCVSTIPTIGSERGVARRSIQRTWSTDLDTHYILPLLLLGLGRKHKKI